MAEEYESPAGENPYAAPLAAPTETAVAAHEDPEVEELRAFVGPKADYYLKKWTSLLDDLGDGAGFNFAAFFLSGFWLAYRKMYKATAILYGFILLESLVEEIIIVGILGGAETPPGLDSIIGLVIAFVCGAYGNRWYYGHAQKVVTAAGLEAVERESRLQLIASRGGTNLGAALGCFVLFVLATFASFAALELALYFG